MNTIRYLSLLVAMLCYSIAINGQSQPTTVRPAVATTTASDTYQPDPPGEPDAPDFPNKPKKDKYTLTLLSSEGGSNLKGAGSYAPGTKVNVSVSPQASYTFIGWFSEQDSLLSSALNFTYTMGEQDVVLTAMFRYTPDVPGEPETPDFPDRPKQPHKITVKAQPAEGGSVSVGSSSVIEGNSTTVKATAATNYTFAGWYVADTLFSEQASFSYVMQTRDIEFVAHFQYTPDTPTEPDTPDFPDRPKPQHLITVSAYPTEGGSVSVGSSKVTEGSTTSVRATAAANYTFSGWYVADTLYNTNATFTYTMQTKDIALVAHFSYTPGVPGEPDTPETSRYELFLKSAVRALPGRSVQYPIYLTCLDTLTDIRFNMSFPVGVTPELNSIILSDKAVGYTLTCEKVANESKERLGSRQAQRRAEDSDLGTYGSTYAFSLTGGRIAPCSTQLISVKLDVDESFTDSVAQRCGINQISMTNTDGTTETASARHGSMVLREVTEQGTYYYLTIISTGNGTTTVSGKAVRGALQEVELLEGTSVYAYFAPDEGFCLSSVVLDGVDVTQQVVEDRWQVNNIQEDVTLEVDYKAIPHARPSHFVVNGVAYEAASDTADVVCVVPGAAPGYQGHLTIPATVVYDEREWTVTALADSAFAGCSQLLTLTVPATITKVGSRLFWGCKRLAAIDWQPGVPLTTGQWNEVHTDNLLLYVSADTLAPSTVQNVVVGDTGERIVLTQEGGEFYCLHPFTASRIEYIHDFRQHTEVGVCRGWESIALPFDATSVRHALAGDIQPFAGLTEEDIAQGATPFWLYELGEDGQWTAAEGVKAYVPYIVSMPNNEAYSPRFLLGGKVTFSAEDAWVGATSEAEDARGAGRVFCANFCSDATVTDGYLLNVSAEYEGMPEGSVFVRNLRTALPFEAYLRLNGGEAARRFIGVFEDVADGIGGLPGGGYDIPVGVCVYDLLGRKVGVMNGNTLPALPQGVYIVAGRKRFVR